MNVHWARIAGAITIVSVMAEAPAWAAASDVALINDASAVAKCERLAEVRGKSAWGGALFAAKSYDWALANMKERAAALGATHVLLLNGTSGFTGSNMLGVAYRCPPQRHDASARQSDD